jgi:hypothetical protein
MVGLEVMMLLTGRMDMAMTYPALIYLVPTAQQMEFIAAAPRRHTLDTGR